MVIPRMEKCCNSWSKGQRGSHIVEEWSRMVNGDDVWGISTKMQETYNLRPGQRWSRNVEGWLRVVNGDDVRFISTHFEKEDHR